MSRCACCSDAAQDVLQSKMPAEDPDLVERAPLSSIKTQQQQQKQPQEPLAQREQKQVADQPGRECELSVKAKGAAGVSITRSSMESQASSSAWGSHAGGGGSSLDCGASYTSPSLRHQVRGAGCVHQ
jgi:hypothetical protein